MADSVASQDPPFHRSRIDPCELETKISGCAASGGRRAATALPMRLIRAIGEEASA